MKYKGYIARVEFDDGAEIFHGEIVNTRDVITFQGTSTEELRQAFQDSVEDYLAFCKERGEEPEKLLSGISPDDSNLFEQFYIPALQCAIRCDCSTDDAALCFTAPRPLVA